MGALNKHNELYPENAAGNEAGDTVSAWCVLFKPQTRIVSSTLSSPRNGNLTEHRQQPIEMSSYVRRIDAGDDEDDELDETETLVKPRYWSDFNRMYFVPRSIHSVSDLPEWEASSLNWEYGKRTFSTYDVVRSFPLQ